MLAHGAQEAVVRDGDGAAVGAISVRIIGEALAREGQR
jgi:hypothetical protein